MTDYINRKTVIKELRENECADLYEQVLIIEDIPGEDVSAVQHGLWEHTGTSWSHLWRCTNCGQIAYYPPRGNRKKRIIQPCGYKYCPNCGAKMDKKEENDRNT